MFGSTVDSMGMPVSVTPNEPQALQSLLQKQFRDSGITVQNAATGGRASSLMNELDGMDGGGPPLPQRLAETSASIIIEEHSVNDAYAGETVSDYTGYLEQWVQAIQASGKIAVLEEPSPLCDSDHPQLPQYVAAMDAIAAKYNVPIIKQYDYIKSITGWQSHMTQCLYPDAYLDDLKAKQEQALVAALVKAKIE
ncbi:GDSL-like Lipase/Acylhydrolase family protein [Paraburkholderia diazotrophica]|uniref:GDSL-like Lipase/Acylhydrolase family protein n=2 Tax=Paraburkholderia diazotrophica TaxID=667676 RepID=A0A1H6QLI8_9BURK|nr:GDSL-like Lipase/Acylhydrolase family protein [Paraburkholderia diazotrophica]